MRNPYSVR